MFGPMNTLADKTTIGSLIVFGLICAATAPGRAEPDHVADYVPGQSYFGRAKYIEYIAGNAPVIFTVPHGGGLTPSEIPDRTFGTMATDRNTAPLAYSFIEAFKERTGLWPHVVFCHLKRTRFDANRDIGEAAQGNEWAEQAWRQWHEFIDIAKDLSVRQAGSVLFIDLHGHGHPMNRLELGYNLNGPVLELCDAEIEKHKARSSLRAAVLQDTFAQLLRGPRSFGAMMQARGFPSVPSPQYPHPQDQPYFYSGYNTRRHTGDANGRVSGFQLECNYEGFRDTSQNRKKASAALADAIVEYLESNHRIVLNDLPGTQRPLTDNEANREAHEGLPTAVAEAVIPRGSSRDRDCAVLCP